MAPTICTEKKRQVRSGLKELRRQTNAISTAPASSSSNGIIGVGSGGGGGGVNGGIGGGVVGGGISLNGNGNNLPSSIINYVAKGALATTLRLRGNGPRVNGSSSSHINTNANKIATEHRLLLQQQQISDNAVSSSTHSDSEQQQQQQRCTFGYTQRRLMHLNADNNGIDDDDDDDMHELDDEIDEADSEVHSINSACCNMISRSNNADFASLQRCTALKTVFPAPTLSDKQLLPTNSNVALAPTNSSQRSSDGSQSPVKPYHTAAPATRRAGTYTNMCELKNTEGLLAIAIKTIKLVKRNQLLQRRLAQLQLETSEFIQSVLANPENQHFRDKMQTSTASSVDTATGSSMKASSSNTDQLVLEWSSNSNSNSSCGSSSSTSSSQQEQHA